MAPRIAVLGTTEVDGVADAGSLTRRDRVVLGALTASHGEPLTIDQLGDALWGDEPPKSSAKVVQGSVMRLRRLLGTDAIETTGAGYRLALDGDTVDSHVFERLVARGRELASAHDPERAAAAYEQALALWRGAPLPELQDWDPGRAEAERLLEVRRSVEEELVEKRMECGLVAAAVADAQHLVRREPYREHRWALLALALYRTGRQREALDAIRRARTTLVDELGLDPGPELVDLEQRILQQDPSLLDVPEAPTAASSICPWPGLRPFDSDQSEMYAGREGDVEACLVRLAAYPLLVVVGASGSGKSSLVRAGVAPRLTADGATVVMIAPGASPVATLTTALSALVDDAMLVVDQLEELFASTRPDDVAAFLDRLADQVGAGHRVVVTLRADYLASLAGSSAFAREAERGLLLLAPMDEAQLREAIEQPARRSGLRLEPGLVDLLLRDVGNDAGGLPLLSHALAETWVRRDGSVLTVEGYRATGGINGAVAQSAERLYESLSADDREGLRAVLQRLVTPTPAGDPVAARVPTRVFDGTDDAPRLLDLLVRARLVTASSDTATLAHESLVRAWPRLSTWLDEDVEGQRVFAHLQVAADGWEAGGRPEDELYRGARLETALEWRARTHPVLAEGEIAFLDASAAYADSEDRRRVAELATQKIRNRQLRGALAGVVGLLVLALVAGSLAIVRGRQAQDSAAAAAASAVLTDAARLSAASRSEQQIDLALLLARQAVQTDDSPARESDLLAALIRSDVLSTTVSERGPNHRMGDTMSPDGRRLLVSDWSDGVRLVDTSTGFMVTGAPLTGDDGDPTRVTSGAGFFAHGSRVAAAYMAPDSSGERSLLVFDSRSGRRLGPPQRVPGSLSGEFFRQDLLHISPDGKTLASFVGRAARIWRSRDGRWLGPETIALPAFPPSIPGQDLLNQVAFSDDGRIASFSLDYQGPPTWATLASISVDLVRRRAVSPWVIGAGTASPSPDGSRWAVATLGSGFALRSTTPAPGGDGVDVATTERAAPQAFAWSADGRLVAAGGGDGSVTVYTVSPLRLVRAFPASGASAYAMSFSDDGDRLVTAEATGRITIRSTRGDNSVMRVTPTTRVSAVSAGPAGTIVAAGLDDGRIAVLDQGSGSVTQVLSLDGSGSPDDTFDPAAHRRVTALAVADGGRTLVAGNRAGIIRKWQLATGRVIWSVGTEPVEQLVVSPDGRWVASVESTTDPQDPASRAPDWYPQTTTFVLRDAVSGRARLHAPVGVDDRAVKGKMLQFSPDSSLVAVPYMNSVVQVYRTAPWPALITTIAPRNMSEHGAGAVLFSPDGTLLLVRAWDDGSIRGFDPRTGAATGSVYPAALGLYGTMAFSPDGRMLFSRSLTGLAAYDASTRRLLFSGLVIGSGEGEGSMAITSDFYLYAATRTGVVRVDLDPRRWKQQACALAGRTLTRDEWSQLLPQRPYDPACA